MAKMSPFRQFVNGLEAAQMDMNEVFTELRGFAEVMANKSNGLEMDEDGFFYVNAAGRLEDVIPSVEKLIDRLKRIKKERDGV